MLAASEISVLRRGRTLLDRVSLTLRPGEFTALLGQNGAGKSTLLHVLSGALVPESGRVTLDGRPLSAYSRAALARRRAVLPQTSSVTFPVTVAEIVQMGRSAHAGITRSSEDAAIARAALAAVDLAGFAARLFPSLSGGERQRVQLARVLAQIWTEKAEGAARFLLLDEPTNHLDLAHQLRLLRFAQGAAQRNLGLLAVLHDPNLAARFADRIVVLKAGRILAEGPPNTILTEDIMEIALGLPVVVQRHPLLGHPQIAPRD